MSRYWNACLLATTLYASAIAAQPGRGELLYMTYCNACHTEQVHWRAKSLAPDWARLGSEVRRWQQNGNLDWSEDDIDLVTRFLNHHFYHYALPAK
jgi:mono/diheme cytochrome c family protein